MTDEVDNQNEEHNDGQELDQDAKTMGMLCHLAAIVPIVGTAAIWLMKKDTIPFVDDQGKEALNFQITMFGVMVPVWIASFILSFIPFIGCLVPLALMGIGLGCLVMIVMAAMDANKGVAHRYPFSIKIIK